MENVQLCVAARDLQTSIDRFNLIEQWNNNQAWA